MRTTAAASGRRWIWLATALMAALLALAGSSSADASWFAPHLEFPAGRWPVAVAVVDLNNDGNLDVLTLNQGDNSVSVLLGNGAGSLGLRTDFATGASPVGLAIRDFDGDGHLDVATANKNDNTVSVLLGDGSGGFGPRSDIATSTDPASVAAGDLNGDSLPDLAVSSTADSTVSIMLNVGGGAFAPPMAVAVPSYPRNLAVGDVTGDGVPDVVGSGGYPGTLFVLPGTGGGSFGSRIDLAMAGNPADSLALGDLNGDGHLDLVAVSRGATYWSGIMSAFLSTGAGTFASRIDTPTVDGPQALALGDLDLDAGMDAAITNQTSDVTVHSGDAAGSFGPQNGFATDDTASAIAIGDLNGDGKPDLVTANIRGGGAATVSVLLNAGAPPTTIEFTRYEFTPGRLPGQIAIGDVNGDGAVDLVTTRWTTIFGGGVIPWDTAVLLGTGTGSFPAATQAASTPVFFPTLNDMDGDGKLDLVGSSGGAVLVLPGSGTGAFTSGNSYPTGGSDVSIAVGDFNNDGAPDVAVASKIGNPASSGTVRTYLGTGAGTLTPAVTVALPVPPTSMALGDLNGDGWLDAVVSNGSSKTVSLLLGDGSGALAFVRDIASSVVIDSVATSDVNADGKLDVVAAGEGLSIMLGDGAGDLAEYSFNAGVRASTMAVGDLNRDGRPDVALSNGRSYLTMLMGDGSGGFPLRIEVAAGAEANWPRIVDLNGDRGPDLVVSSFQPGKISVMLQSSVGVGGIAAQPDLSALSAQGSGSTGDHRTLYAVGGAAAVLVAIVEGARATRRRRTGQ
jgi:VCBS repeat protein/FG-GAP repeat protein